MSRSSRRAALERAGREDRDPAWREHATPYIYRHPELFRICGSRPTATIPSARWSVDTPRGLRGSSRGSTRRSAATTSRWREALAVVEANPYWVRPTATSSRRSFRRRPRALSGADDDRAPRPLAGRRLGVGRHRSPHAIPHPGRGARARAAGGRRWRPATCPTGLADGLTASGIAILQLSEIDRGRTRRDRRDDRR